MQQTRKSKLSRAMALTGRGLVAPPRRPLISLSSDTRFQEKAKTILRFGITSFRLALIPADANPLLPGKPRPSGVLSRGNSPDPGAKEAKRSEERRVGSEYDYRATS